MSKIKLAPCPFCGSEAEQDYQRGFRTITGARLDSAAAIYCTSCNADMAICRADTPELSDEERMLTLEENWNRRHSSLEDKIDGLQSDLDSAVEVAYQRGATEWTRLNYPDHFKRLSTAQHATQAPLAFPRELTEVIRDVLSTMIWQSGKMAHCLRAGGQIIPTRAEDEQAHVLHWLICLALQHGGDWRSKASDYITEIRDAVAAAQSASTEGADHA